MREILFKAKRIDNGEWVEGYVFSDGIINSERMFVGGLVITDYKGTADDKWNVGIDFYEVIPSTICQYTGLTDKNGNKIWENDIVEESSCGYVGFVEYMGAEYSIEWNGQPYIRHDILFWVQNRELEAVGNIFDNLELLKGE